MKRMLMLLTATVMVAALLTFAATAGAQTLTPCMGGCDAEYPITYDAQAMWAVYGYPTYYNGCWWYDVEGTWWYMCPTGTAEPHNLYPYYG